MGNDIDRAGVAKAYAAWAPIYDLVFGQVFDAGRKATIALADQIGGRILDVGIGTGLSLTDYSRTTKICGVDISEPMLRKARERARTLNLTNVEALSVMDAKHLAFADGTFDAVVAQYVVTAVPEPEATLDDFVRVLKPGGKFATFDVVLNSGDPLYPVPWARTPGESFLLTAEATCEAIEAAGFGTLVRRDDTTVAKAWFAELRASGPPPTLNLGVVMGQGFAELATNLGRNLMEGRLGILTAVFEAVPVN